MTQKGKQLISIMKKKITADGYHLLKTTDIRQRVRQNHPKQGV